MRVRRRSPTTVTPYHVEAVRQLSPQRLQGDIAALLGIAVATVGRIQRRHGFEHLSRQAGRAVARQEK